MLSTFSPRLPQQAGAAVLVPKSEVTEGASSAKGRKATTAIKAGARAEGSFAGKGKAPGSVTMVIWCRISQRLMEGRQDRLFSRFHHLRQNRLSEARRKCESLGKLMDDIGGPDTDCSVTEPPSGDTISKIRKVLIVAWAHNLARVATRYSASKAGYDPGRLLQSGRAGKVGRTNKDSVLTRRDALSSQARDQ